MRPIKERKKCCWTRQHSYHELRRWLCVFICKRWCFVFRGVTVSFTIVRSPGNCQYSLHRFSHFDFLQVLKKRMIASLFPTLLAKIFLVAVLLSRHAKVYQKHYSLSMMAARFVSTEGKVNYIHTAVTILMGNKGK